MATIAGIACELIIGSDRVWTRPPLQQVLTLSGTGRSEVHRLGYGRWKRRVKLLTTDANAPATFAQLVGTEIAVVDEWGSWRCTLDETSVEPTDDPDWLAQGFLTLTRSGT